jgi:aryl-alcohol dehydrogenase-like predicted oxidoreductase
MNKHLKRLVLGTAQFGSANGIKNLKKKNLINHINILKKAKKNKIKYIDTAPSYKEKEKKI